MGRAACLRGDERLPIDRTDGKLKFVKSTTTNRIQTLRSAHAAVTRDIAHNKKLPAAGAARMAAAVSVGTDVGPGAPVEKKKTLVAVGMGDQETAAGTDRSGASMGDQESSSAVRTCSWIYGSPRRWTVLIARSWRAGVEKGRCKKYDRGIRIRSRDKTDNEEKERRME